MKGKIKNINDFILGLLMLCVSIFLICYDGITTEIPKISQGGFFTRADVYIRMLAVILAGAAIVLIIRSVVVNGNKEGRKFHFRINSTVCITVVALLLYTLMLPLIGFYVCSFVMIIALNLLYTYKENDKKIKEYSMQEIIKALIFSVIYAIGLMVILWLVFSRLLGVRLP